jgi:hypothetical protein
MNDQLTIPTPCIFTLELEIPVKMRPGGTGGTGGMGGSDSYLRGRNSEQKCYQFPSTGGTYLNKTLVFICNNGACNWLPQKAALSFFTMCRNAVSIF